MGITGVVTAAAFETIAVSTAMPEAVKAVNGLGAYAWAFNGVVIATLVATVAGGDYSDRKGPKLPLIGGLIVFAVGLLVCATAQVMPIFVIGRVLQGLGGGAAIVAVYVVVARGYEAKIRAQVFSALAAAWVVPSLVGPFIAGAIAEFWTWRVVFFAVVPIVVIAMFLVWPLVSAVEGPGGIGHGQDKDLADAGEQATQSSRSGRTRWAASLAAGAVLIQDGGRRLGLIGAGEALIGLVIVGFALQRLLPRGSLRLARGLPSAIGARGLLAGAFFGAQAFVPLMLVDQRGLGLTLAGLSLTTSSLGWFLGSWWQGRPDLTIHRDRLITVGALCAFIGLVLMTLTVTLPATAIIAGLAWAVGGFGMGITIPAVNVWVLGMSSGEEQGANSAALQLGDGAGVLTCTALAGVIYGIGTAPAGQQQVTFLSIFVTMTAVCIVAIVAASRLSVVAPSVTQVSVTEPARDA